MASRTIARRIATPIAIAFLLFAVDVALLAIPGAWLMIAFCLVLLPPALELAILAIIAVALIALFWWRDRVSGIAMALGLAALVLLVRVPTYADSSERWVADFVQVIYYGGELRKQEAELEREGISPAVAAKLLDGFITGASGLALDRHVRRSRPSRYHAW